MIEAVCDEPIQICEQQLIRVVYPAPDMDAPQGIGAHQDGDLKLVYQANFFYTV